MLKLNCDIGESFGIWKLGEDEKIMPLIDMANIACGFHASDPLNMTKTILLAKRFNVEIGAHPSYQDLVGFGRRSIPYSKDELKAIILYQIGALRAIANANGVDISYIKPHGALYNDMMKSLDIFMAINEAIYSYDKKLSLMILSTSKNSEFERISKVKLIFEAFADRAYSSDGFLVARSKKGSVIKDKNKVIKRVRDLVKRGVIYDINNKELKLKVDSLCVHGDNEEALSLVKVIKDVLDEI
ncbi:MAG: 5-oxoprolinase subunit PxpA [Epsilonproteobacteria bacterium]|nr:5-oxoprolinase subunit PxpA [Campylobacterota bacterium]